MAAAFDYTFLNISLTTTNFKWRLLNLVIKNRLYQVDDIVLGTYLAWKKSKNKEYMIGTNKGYSVKEIAKCLGQVLNDT